MNKKFLSKDQLESIIIYASELGIDYIQIYNSYKIKKYAFLDEKIVEKIFVENGISINLFINNQSFFISTTNYNVDYIKILIKEKIPEGLTPKKFKGLNNLIEEKEEDFDEFTLDKINCEKDSFINAKKDILNLKITLLSEKNIVVIANSKGIYLKKIEYHYKIDILMKVKASEKIRFNYYNNGVSSNINSLKYLNIKQNTYSQYENGKREIPIEMLWKLADFYNTSIDYIIGRTENPTRL